MKNQRYTIAAFVFLLSLGVFTSCGNSNEQKVTTVVTPIVVTTYTVTNKAIATENSYAAEIKSEKITQLSTKLMGRIYNFNFEAGDLVPKGKVIARIESAGIQSSKARIHAQVEMAEIGLKNAEKDFDRITKLHQLESATDKELDDITTHFLSAKAQLISAKKAEDEVNANLSYTLIKAPYNGVITKKYMTGGDMATPGMPIVEFASSASFKAIATIPSAKINQFKKGETAHFIVDANGKTYTGKVKRIVPSGSFNGGQFKVEFTLDSQKGLNNGLYAKVTTAQEVTEKIVVPAESIYVKGQLTGVFLVNMQKEASLTWVRVGKKYDDKIEVLSGIQSDDIVITPLPVSLYDGQPVKYSSQK
ncbi:efflux RND transporter periplasmic adaptor subunit [Flammeovirga pectinis]|uniref:Efflux RND transporter periplasmic adaptor subunit n=1 Tax=Flammeovirga pectinis TaxID=2494373 RepID=A0A3S9P7A0_9BACT|nr:efflux RND transporter periplasmic adaptor subunit [Flammeovirga pectinis]AZQ64024.1 efflux RND transporter periplasmic adaptor subunit [Flammeovirga pectinis]